MGWARVRFDWNRARAFLVTAEEGSFSAAGRALGIAQPTIGRQVSALEQELDVALFTRGAGGLELTPTGVELLEQVRSMGESATRVSRIAAGQSLSLAGPVCVSAAELTAAYTLPPIITRIRAAHPGIEIEIVASNETSDLGRREADIAIRSFRPTQPDLVSRKLGEGAAYLYATPSYLASIGDPTSCAELSRADFMAFDRTATLMNGLNGLGLTLTSRNFPWVTQSQHVQWALVLQGAGVGIMTADIGESESRVRRALPALPPIPVPMWLTSHQDVRTSRRVRVVFDMLADGLVA